jgi:hypothetical protein
MSYGATQTSRQIAAPHGGVEAFYPTRRKAKRVEGAIVVGDGGVTAFHDNGGRILQHPGLILIFWGNAWTNPATTPSQSDFMNAVSNLVHGPWGTQLSQYRGIGPLSLDQTVTVTSSDPPTTFTDPEIQNMIEAQITAGVVPAPDNAVDRIYCVLMPTGHSSGDTPFVGQHQVFDFNGARCYWAWITNDGTLTGGNSIPKVLSHEVCEACSDPDLGSGILVDVGTDKNEEIGDVCNNTWSTVNGAAEEAYWSETDNRCVLPVWQSFPAVKGNPSLIQGRFGTQGNFELAVPSGGGGVIHFWRNDDNTFLPWSGPIFFGGALGMVDAVSMIESNFGSPGNLELVCRVADQLYFFWRDSGPAFNWNGPFPLEGGVGGNPVLIQSRFGIQGNFDLVVPSAVGGLVHFWRNNDDQALPWSAPTFFGGALGMVDAVSMIESNFGSPGNLELVCRVADQLYFFWRDSGPAFNWNGPFPLEGGVGGNPVLIQSRFGTQGNFELVVPSAVGGLVHFWRNNDDQALPWSGPIFFGGALGMVDAVTMIESNFGSPGNLELVCRVADQPYFFWRDSGPAFNWNGPFLLESTVW